MCGADCQEVVDFSDAVGQRRWSDEPADAPAGDRIGLAGAADRDRALRHSGQRGDTDVLAFVDEVLIDLVRDGDRVMLLAQVGYELQFLAAVDLSRRVVGRVYHY